MGDGVQALRRIPSRSTLSVRPYSGFSLRLDVRSLLLRLREEASDRSGR